MFNRKFRFKLPTDAVHAGLPLIDTRKTTIERVCPSRVKRPQCSVQRYRELSGLCNNLEHAHWGAVNAPFRRLLPAAYADGTRLKPTQPRNFQHEIVIHFDHFLLLRDFCHCRYAFRLQFPFQLPLLRPITFIRAFGQLVLQTLTWTHIIRNNGNDLGLFFLQIGVSLPRISVTGDQLPTARFVSTFIHRDLGFHDHAVTVFLPAFGQLIDHDMALGAETKGNAVLTPSGG